jgi:hypothetical protein
VHLFWTVVGVRQRVIHVRDAEVEPVGDALRGLPVPLGERAQLPGADPSPTDVGFVEGVASGSPRVALGRAPCCT